MLSKASLLLLGIINQTEINAYELIRVLKEMQIKNWLPIANSTVYTTLKKLQKNGFIDGHSIKEGNMPEKVCYKITKNGNCELENNIREIISSFSYDPTYFSIASFFITIIKKDEVLELLKKRDESLNKYEKGIKIQLEFMKSNKVDPIYICNVNRNKMIIENEINITKIYLEEIKNSDKWDINILKNMII